MLQDVCRTGSDGNIEEADREKAQIVLYIMPQHAALAFRRLGGFELIGMGLWVAGSSQQVFWITHAFPSTRQHVKDCRPGDCGHLDGQDNHADGVGTKDGVIETQGFIHGGNDAAEKREGYF
jgi:hypothetical protein